MKYILQMSVTEILDVQIAMDYFTVVAELPGLWLEARLPVTLF